MGTTFFLILCAAAEGFLLYVLVHFLQEGKRGKSVKKSPAMVLAASHSRNVSVQESQSDKVIRMDSTNVAASSLRLRRHVS